VWGVRYEVIEISRFLSGDAPPAIIILGSATNADTFGSLYING